MGDVAVPSNGIRVSALLFGLLAGGCGDTAESLPPTPLWTSLTDASGLQPTDEIDGLDLVAGNNGDLHLVWQERIGTYGDRRRERIVYRRAGGKPLRWSPPVAVAENRAGKPQVAVARDGVHVFAGARLHHWLLPTGGDAFVDQGALLTGEGPRANGFDAIASGDGIVIVFVAPDSIDDQKVYGVRWSAAGHTAPVAIADIPRAMPTWRLAPKLYPLNGRLMTVWAEMGSANTFDEQTRVTTLNSAGRVHTAWSEDGGLSWEKATEVTPGSPPPSIRAVAAAGTAEASIAFFAADGLFGSRWSRGAWTSPVRIEGYAPGSLSGSAETTAVAAAQCGKHTAVAWVDARYRRSDRRWWNPLGGIPWSDNPDWYNNDLFVATHVDLEADPDAVAIRPVRLTPAESFTSEIAIAQRDRELVVLRAGRARVRKSPGDAGAPPVILQSQIPCG